MSHQDTQAPTRPKVERRTGPMDHHHLHARLGHHGAHLRHAVRPHGTAPGVRGRHRRRHRGIGHHRRRGRRLPRLCRRRAGGVPDLPGLRQGQEGGVCLASQIEACQAGHLPVRYPNAPRRTHTARSSSGSGRRPLKAEITSSNLVRATKLYRAPSGALLLSHNPPCSGARRSPCPAPSSARA